MSAWMSPECSFVVAIDIAYVWYNVILDVTENVLIVGADVVVDVTVNSTDIHLDIHTDISGDISSDVKVGVDGNIYNVIGDVRDSAPVVGVHVVVDVNVDISGIYVDIHKYIFGDISLDVKVDGEGNM